MIGNRVKSASLSNLARLKLLGNVVADLLFPPRCVGCRRFGSWFCDSCLGKVETIDPPVCSRCGRPEPAAPGRDGGSVCHRCRSAPPHVDRLLACAYHDDPLRQAIQHFKYEGLTILAAPLGELMAAGWAAHSLPAGAVDLIVPVPLHVSRQRERGYNQAALLARELGRHLGTAVAEDALVRTRHTRPQVGLHPHDRQANVRGAFRCVTGACAGRRVLLVDDVCTTGSTLEAACSALRDGGALSVWAYTLARARPGYRPTLE